MRSVSVVILLATAACSSPSPESSSTNASAQQGRTFSGYGTDFEKLGEPYGGCGVPESLLFDDNGKKLPYIALNVQNTTIEEPILPRPIQQADKVGLFANGRNCGRWIEITVGNDCRNATQNAHEGKICVQADGSHGPEYYKTQDELNGKVLYGVIADSCQDPNYWCRNSQEHVDISTHELLDMLAEWGSDRTKWNNRQVTWKFISEPPAKFQLREPKFAWAPNAMPYWPALIIYNLRNGLSKVEIKSKDSWIPATMNSDMGQLWILAAPDSSPQPGQGAVYSARIYDASETLLGTYELTLPAECEKGCKDVVKIEPTKSGGAAAPGQTVGTATGTSQSVATTTTTSTATATASTPATGGESEGLVGMALYEGIKSIIGADPNLPRDQVASKPFMGSFSTIKSQDDAGMATTGYCMTDNACGHFEAYSSTGVPLSELQCNKFCYVDPSTKKFKTSQKYTVQNPPASYLCCGWETCE
jgi:hypothetical protein